MPQDIKLWGISEDDQLNQVEQTPLDLEERLEDWLEDDISLISDDLLIIGRQVTTDFGGYIDLLCMDPLGDLVVVELKRDKTPRDVSAQALDYGAWVRNLSFDDVESISNQYFKDQDLEEKFENKFEAELPDTLNEEHRMLIVASQLDSDTERIVDYLSDEYGVGINAVTFQYFEEGEDEYLARTFFIEQEESSYRQKRKGNSKRKPDLTYEELRQLAKENGVYDLYTIFEDKLDEMFDYSSTTRSSIAFAGDLKEDDGDTHRRTIFSLLPEESNKEEGLRYKVYVTRFSKYLDMDGDRIRELLPPIEKEEDPDKTGKWYGAQGYFSSKEQINNFIENIK